MIIYILNFDDSFIEYAAHGCLYEYLSQNTLDFKNILQWAKEIASGLFIFLEYERKAPFRYSYLPKFVCHLIRKSGVEKLVMEEKIEGSKQ